MTWTRDGRGELSAFRGICLAVFALLIGVSSASADGWFLAGSLGAEASTGSSLSATASPGVVYFERSPSTFSSREAGLRPTLFLSGGRMWSPGGGAFSLGFEVEAGYLGASGAAQAGTYALNFAPLADQSDQANVSVNWSSSFEAAASLRLAYRLAPGFSVFGSVGPAVGSVHMSATLSDVQTYEQAPFFCFGGGGCGGSNAYATHADLRRWDPGLHFGVGLEKEIFSGTTVRLEYAETDFATIKQSLENPLSLSNAAAKVTPRSRGVRIGVAHSF